MEKTMPVGSFIEALKTSLNDSNFIRLSISNKRQKSNELNKISGRPVLLKSGQRISFVYHYPTKEITKNLTFEECYIEVLQLLTTEFRQAELLTSKTNWFLNITKDNKGILRKKTVVVSDAPTLAHDNVKQRLLDAGSAIYFKELGITGENAQVKPSMFHKFKQINKYIEIVDGIIKDVPFGNSVNIVDMGAGKGYLTFALYDYMNTVLKKEAHIRGIEFRTELVTECKRIAALAGFENLEFEAGSIKDTSIDNADILIALHACDTATDEAIFKGITSGCEVIICAPCCHKQIRKQLNPENAAKNITEHGILKERLAEIITDTIRALIMEAFGYKTKVFEFIETEHTPKNVLIAGVKRKTTAIPDNQRLSEVRKLKELCGIKTHHLETLLGI